MFFNTNWFEQLKVSSNRMNSYLPSQKYCIKREKNLKLESNPVVLYKGSSTFWRTVFFPQRSGQTKLVQFKSESLITKPNCWKISLSICIEKHHINKVLKLTQLIQFGKLRTPFWKGTLDKGLSDPRIRLYCFLVNSIYVLIFPIKR